jgi:hypothetical protein
MTSRSFMEDSREFGRQVYGGLLLLVLRGDERCRNAVEASARVVRELVPRAEVRVYERAAMVCMSWVSGRVIRS